MARLMESMAWFTNTTLRRNRPFAPRQTDLRQYFQAFDQRTRECRGLDGNAARKTLDFFKDRACPATVSQSCSVPEDACEDGIKDQLEVRFDASWNAALHEFIDAFLHSSIGMSAYCADFSNLTIASCRMVFTEYRHLFVHMEYAMADRMLTDDFAERLDRFTSALIGATTELFVVCEVVMEALADMGLLAISKSMHFGVLDPAAVPPGEYHSQARYDTNTCDFIMVTDNGAQAVYEAARQAHFMDKPALERPRYNCHSATALHLLHFHDRMDPNELDLFMMAHRAVQAEINTCTSAMFLFTNVLNDECAELAHIHPHILRQAMNASRFVLQSLQKYYHFFYDDQLLYMQHQQKESLYGQKLAFYRDAEASLQNVIAQREHDIKERADALQNLWLLLIALFSSLGVFIGALPYFGRDLPEQLVPGTTLPMHWAVALVLLAIYGIAGISLYRRYRLRPDRILGT